MSKVKQSHDGWGDLPVRTPETVEVVEWEDTEVFRIKTQRSKLTAGLGRVFSVGLVVKETKRALSLAQSLYIPSEKGYAQLVGDVITIPKSIIKRRTIVANAE